MSATSRFGVVSVKFMATLLQMAPCQRQPLEEPADRGAEHTSSGARISSIRIPCEEGAGRASDSVPAAAPTSATSKPARYGGDCNGRSARRANASAGEHGADLGEQLGARERLGEVVVGRVRIVGGAWISG